ncbi:DUF58 domain-containing protein [Salegentibacter sp. F14]
MRKFFKSLYLTQRFFQLLFGISVGFLFSYWIPFLYPVTWMVAVLMFVLVLIDIGILFKGKGISAKRILPVKFSNSDENEVKLEIRNLRNFKIHCELIDELPLQFQKRDFLMRFLLEAGTEKEASYFVRPVARGEYHFGRLNIFTTANLGLVKKRYTFDSDQMVKVYPSFKQMRQLDFLATDQRISRPGLKKIRRIGHTMEFEQIKEYVRGDDARTINWKATAKQGNLMVNQFQDERSQPVYSVIDTGRVMKMPFEGLSLLDYAINSSLAFSNIALKKKDKVGLISFSNKMEFLLKANSRMSQLNLIQEHLYNIETNYFDSDYGLLYSHLKKQLPQRSLLILYTNFEHISGLKKRLASLKALAKNHLLVVILFENTTLHKLIEAGAKDIHIAAHQTVAEEFEQNKKLILKELQRNGIQAILSKPEKLSINTINKYLEIKARGML